MATYTHSFAQSFTLSLAPSCIGALAQFTQNVMTQPARMEESPLYLALFVRQKEVRKKTPSVVQNLFFIQLSVISILNRTSQQSKGDNTKSKLLTNTF